MELELPGDEVANRVEDLLLRRGVRVQRVGIAEEGHCEGLGIEAGGVRPHDRPVYSARAALVEASETIDHEVVAEVVDLDPLGEPRVDVAHLLRSLCGGVVVGRHDVMHEGNLERVGVRRTPATQRFIGTPLGTGDDGRLAYGGLRRCRGQITGQGRVLSAHGIVDERDLGIGRDLARRGVYAHLDAIGGVGDDRLSGEACALTLLRVGIGHVVADGHLHPRKPLTVLAHAHDNARRGVEGLGSGNAHEAKRLGIGRGDGRGRPQHRGCAGTGHRSLVGVVFSGDGHRGARRGSGGKGVGGYPVQGDRRQLRPDRIRGAGKAAGDREGECRRDDEGSRHRREKSHPLRVPEAERGGKATHPTHRSL